MKYSFKKLLAAVSASALCVSATVPAVTTDYATEVSGASSNVVEYLDRGISAVSTGSGMLVNWRYLASDSDNAVFKLYRDNTLIYTSNAGDATCYLDASGSGSSKYRVDLVEGGVVKSSETCKLTSANAYFDVKLSRPSSIYTPNDCSVGDVDGDGQYELFVKWDPNTSKDNSQKGVTDPCIIDCYRLDGTKLWRINIGTNIRSGAHYTQFFVADFDLDGKAEMTCKTADGTVDGQGNVIGDASANYRDSSGLIYSGPEYYTLFDGETGKALHTIDYEPGRGDPTKWGKSSDKYNRVERYWGAVAYLDGVTPSVVTGRGYYGRMTATAYTVKDDKLVKLWAFDTGTSSSSLGYGDGNHNSMPADVDGDGKQEIITGSTCIDDNGKIKWCTNQGHGDAMHVGDLLPDNPGIEVYICHEDKPYGVTLIDGDTGAKLFHIDADGDTGRCCADNVWTGNDGAEFWFNTTTVNGSGATLSCRRPAINFLSYWDGDLEREILDGYTDSPATITDMGADGILKTILTTDGYYTCNTTKGTPCLSADIFGDWREELIVRAADGNSVRIYATTYDTDYRIQTLMHDPQYRNQVASQQVAYNQPPHPSFYLGTEKGVPARPQATVGASSAVKPGAVIDTSHKYTITNANSGLNLMVADGKAENGADVVQGTGTGEVWTLVDAGEGYYKIYSEVGDGKTYLLDLAYGATDNGTNIGIWGDTACDAQSFKFVSNGDGTYTICTKSTSDDSCIGIVSGSKDAGATAVQWACDGSANQSWKLNIKVDPINGKLIKNLVVNDIDNYMDWKIDDSIALGDLVFGDRDVTYATFPESVIGAESILTACDSKAATGTVATFKAGADIKVYVALDTRVTTPGSWLSGWTKTDMTAVNNKDVSFVFYEKSFAEGETVSLGENGQTATCVNYTVFAKAEEVVEPTEPVTTTTTTTAPVTTTTTTTTATTPAVTTAATTVSETETTAMTLLTTTSTSTTITQPTTTTTASTTVSETETTVMTLLTTTSTSTTTTQATTTTEPIVIPDGNLYGDVNLDNDVDVADLVAINMYLLNPTATPLSIESMANSDCERNNILNSTDSTLIMNYVAMIIEKADLGKA